MLTVYELATYLKVSKDTIYAMVRENEIPYKRIRRRIMFHKEIIDEWIKGQID